MGKELETLLARLRQEQEESRAKLASLSGKGLDRIRNEDDLEISMHFMTAVELDKVMTEEEFAERFADEYARLLEIAGRPAAPEAKEDGTG
jgi:hypothetical protein